MYWNASCNTLLAEGEELLHNHPQFGQAVLNWHQSCNLNISLILNLPTPDIWCDLNLPIPDIWLVYKCQLALMQLVTYFVWGLRAKTAPSFQIVS